MTTEDAFEEMINFRNIHEKLDIKPYTVRRIRLDLKKGCLKMSLDRKIELLKQAGYFVKMKMDWGHPDEEDISVLWKY